MALFSRVNVSTRWLSYCYCKFSTGAVKLKSRGRATSISSALIQEKIKEYQKKGIKTSRVKSTFDIEIATRRNQACRSILVQVYSINSQDDLHNYCVQFGEILSMHHYHLNRQHNYVLVEFKEEASVSKALSAACFVNTDIIAPVKSPVLWFRKGQLTSSNKHQNKQTNIKSKVTANGYTCLSDAQIANELHRAKSISGQITDLYEVLKLSDLEIRLRFHTAHHLEQYVSGLFQNVRILPFGSSINGFGRRRCDLDLVLLRDDADEKINDNSKRLVFYSKPMKLNDRQDTREFLAMLANSMHYFIPGIRNVRRILEARVPIVKFNYEFTHIECDLSITNMTGMYMSEMLSLYGEIDWRVRPLVTVIRKWAKSQRLTSDSPGQWITNFPLSLLVLFYLQQKNILPSLRQLRAYSTYDDIRSTDGIDCTFLRDITKLPPEYKYKSNQDSLEMLLRGFFEYYAKYDFHSLGVCIREGVPIRKPSRSPLHIENPLETTLNVCKNVSVFEVNRIAEKAREAVYILETSDKFKNNSWGLMALLNMEVDDDTTSDVARRSAIDNNIAPPSEERNPEKPEAEKPEIEDYSEEKYSQEISDDKIEVSDDDQQSNTKKEEII